VDIALYFITALAYGILAVWDYRLQLADPEAPDALNRQRAEARIYALIPVVWLLHAGVIYPGLFMSSGLNLALGHVFSLIGLLVVALYWVGSRTEPIGILRAAVLLLAALLALMPTVFPSAHTVNAHTLAFQAHIMVSLAAYSLFVIAALHATIMSVQEKRLHAGLLSGVFGRLPPLVVMDTLLFRMVMTGFILLTFAVLSGVLFSEALFGKPFTWNHKNLLGLMSWIVFAALLLGRWGYGLRGRRAARWTIVGFVILCLGYLGSKFVLEVILHKV
jgi:ABC-type uncharacterized transport system permease subunit